EAGGTLALAASAVTLDGPLSNAGTVELQGGTAQFASYVQTASGQLAIGIGGTNAGSDYDQLAITRDVTPDGARDASFINSFVSSFGQSFTIIDNQGSNPVSGTFAGLAEGSYFYVGGRQFRISYAGGDGNDVVLTDTSFVVTNTNDSGAGSL